MRTGPSWGWLYGLAVMMLALLAVVDLDVAAGPWRRTLEIAVTVAAFVAIHVWVRANRRALDLVGARDAADRAAASLDGLLTADSVTRASGGHGMAAVMDLVYVGLALGFFGLTWLFVKLCERV